MGIIKKVERKHNNHLTRDRCLTLTVEEIERDGLGEGTIWQCEECGETYELIRFGEVDWAWKNKAGTRNIARTTRKLYQEKASNG